jgi:hypothetical protein
VVSVVIVVVETLDVLFLDTSFTNVAVTWAMNTDKAKGDCISPLEAGPAPPTQASQVSASTLGIVANVSN